MAKKTLKKKAQRKSAAKSATAPVMESAREIWLAGLGAFNVAQQEGSRILEEGGKIFDRLVAEGTRLETRTRKDVEGAVDELRGEVDTRMAGVREQADAVRRQAADNWDRLETIFENRVARALAGLGIPTREEVNHLEEKVRVLSRQVAELDAKTSTVKAQATRATKAAKAARKTATKAAPRKTQRKKVTRKKTARKKVAKSAATKKKSG